MNFNMYYESGWTSEKIVTLKVKILLNCPF